jgi:acyl dehydratase
MSQASSRAYGRYLEDFEEGVVFKHALRKTITESDNNLFSLLTMNHHPAHLDIIYAADSQHGKILVVGTYVFSLVVGITVADISGLAIANLDYENIDHLAPVFVGDTISVSTEVLSIRESKSKQDRGVVYVVTTAFNQHKNPVLKFRRHVLIKRRD